MTDRYAVMGNPIEHSKSPRIHALFADQTGQDMTYAAHWVAQDGFATAAQAFRAAGGRGLNVTVPFKTEAYALADVCSERAESAGAVNTLVLDGDAQIRGDNTDGAGLVRDLCGNLGVSLNDKRILILGAGGAVRGVLGPLLAEQPDTLRIANRTESKARALAERFASLGSVTGGGWEDVEGEAFDCIINGTAAGLEGKTPPLPDDALRPGGVCYDLVYGDEPTAFVRWGQAHGAAISADGLGMLVEQAAESFYIWRGVRPETRPVIEALAGSGAYPRSLS